MLFFLPKNTPWDGRYHMELRTSASLINNRAGGNAPLIAERIAKELRPG
jgi:hypothetical protein